MIPHKIRVVKRLLAVIARQQAEINQLRAVDVRTATADVELAYMRIGRDLIEQFLIALDTPENNDEIRQRLFVSLGFYRDEIAVREEHV